MIMNSKSRFFWIFFFLIILMLIAICVFVLKTNEISERRPILKEPVANKTRPYNFKSFEKSKEIMKDGYEYFNVEIHKKYMNNPNVTKIIHQSWKNKEVPSFFKRYTSSWKECFPHWEYKYWTDEDNRNLIAKHYPWFLTKYDSFPAPIYKADCSRYVYMLHYGGIYSDMDNECLYPFEHLLSNYTMVFGTIDHVWKQTPLEENYVQNSFIYSRPNHPIWTELLLDIVHGNKVDRADISTGPIVLSNVIHKYRTKYPKSHNIKVYAARYFNPLTWGDKSKNPGFCKLYNGMSDKEYKLCHEYHVKKGSYVVQYHTHVWG